MEKGLKKSKTTITPIRKSKDRRRGALRESFGESHLPQRWVPYEIWQDILLKAPLQTMGLLARTSSGFWELVEDTRDKYVIVALRYRQADQIPLARKCLTQCAHHGDPEAMYRMGHTILWKNGWGFSSEELFWMQDAGIEWLKKATAARHPAAHPELLYVLDLSTYQVIELGAKHDTISTSFISKNYNTKFEDNGTLAYAAGLCYHWGVGGKYVDATKALELFKISAIKGCEYGMDMYATFCNDKEEYLEWKTKCASIGGCQAQQSLYYHYYNKFKAVDCNERDREVCIYWLKKMSNQCRGLTNKKI